LPVGIRAVSSGRVDASRIARSAFPLALIATALAALGGACYVLAVSKIAPYPLGQALLAALVLLSFVAAGAVALRRPPYGRFGLLLAAVGFSSLVPVLHEANGAVPYTIGVLSSNLVFAVLAYALLAYPKGRLGSRGPRLLAAAAFVTVLVLQAVAVVFDPLTRWHSGHPRNVALVDSRSSLATGLLELEAALAIAIVIAVAWLLAARARRATPAARRQLVPVLWWGSGGLAIMAVGLAAAPVSSRAGFIGNEIGLLAALALPVAFLGIVLESRLSSGTVGELLVELQERSEAPGLQAALRNALGDPQLDLLVRDAAGDGYRDEDGRRAILPASDDIRTQTMIEHQGEPVGALVHDRSLRLRPELLEAVGAAAGFALANERALERARLVEARNRALLDAIPDLMIRAARDGTYLDVRSPDPSAVLRPAAELIGRNVREVVPPAIADMVLACVERALDTGEICTVEYELEIEGERRWKESRMVPSGHGEVVTIVRDFTETRQIEAEQRRLGEEQAALRRVATLVAGGAPPERVFQTVVEEACVLLGIRSALLVRYEDGEYVRLVGRFGELDLGLSPGDLLRLDEGAALTVLRTGATAHVDYADLSGESAKLVRSLGFRSSVGVPISVAGETWGALIAALQEGQVLPGETERRLGEFAELVALAVASAQAREELSASRLRIVEASDAERRRLERNLHDGAQQRLVALAVGLRLAQAKIRDSPDEAEEHIAIAADELTQALQELRELAQGIHPAILTERGLPSALEVLAARAPLPVSLDMRLPEPLPDAVEAAAYYVVSEALANVVKHACAGEVRVRVERANGHAVVEVADDGAGGADPATGSGLRGLGDRVEALAGRLEVESSPGCGTLVRAELPVAGPEPGRPAVEA
jgi:PAS domain S-box-containing protein